MSTTTSTLREFLGANAWIAMTACHPVGSALIKLRDDGVPVDCPAWFATWKNVRTTGQLVGDLQARLVGPESHDPNALRYREASRRRRILSLFRADGRTIGEIAEAEGIAEQEVEAIVRGELKAHRRAVAEAKSHEKVRRQHDAERAERIREAFRICGRRLPKAIEQQIAE